jgi:hypothetical protein
MAPGCAAAIVEAQLSNDRTEKLTTDAVTAELADLFSYAEQFAKQSQRDDPCTLIGGPGASGCRPPVEKYPAKDVLWHAYAKLATAIPLLEYNADAPAGRIFSTSIGRWRRSPGSSPPAPPTHHSRSASSEPDGAEGLLIPLTEGGPL